MSIFMINQKKKKHKKSTYINIFYFSYVNFYDYFMIKSKNQLKKAEKRIHRECENMICLSSKYTKVFSFSYVNFYDKI